MREPGHIKRANRIATWHRATLVRADGGEAQVVVTDLSSAGFKFEGDSVPMIGELVHIRVDRYGDFPARIRWALGTQAGGEFLEPVVLD